MSRLTGILILCLATVGATPAGAKTDAPLDSLALEGRWRTYAAGAAETRPALEFPYAHCFQQAATAHDLPETLLLAVARGESDFQPKARSHANAYGLMQILWPGTAKHLGLERLSELLEPCTNVDAGARYLRELLENYDGNLHRALAAYNYGPSRIPKTGQDLPDGAVWYSGEPQMWTLSSSASMPNMPRKKVMSAKTSSGAYSGGARSRLTPLGLPVVPEV